MLNIPGIKGAQQSANPSPLSDAPVEAGVTEDGTFLRTLESIHEVSEPGVVAGEGATEKMISATAESPAAPTGGDNVLDTVAVNLSLAAANEPMAADPKLALQATVHARPPAQTHNNDSIVAVVEPQTALPSSAQPPLVTAQPATNPAESGVMASNADTTTNLSSQAASQAAATIVSASRAKPDVKQESASPELQGTAPQRRVEGQSVDVKTPVAGTIVNADQKTGSEPSDSNTTHAESLNRPTVPSTEPAVSGDQPVAKTPVVDEAEAALRSSFPPARETADRADPTQQPVALNSNAVEERADVAPPVEGDAGIDIDEAERAVVAAGNPLPAVPGTDSDRVQRAQSVPAPRPVDAGMTEQAPSAPTPVKQEQQEPVVQNTRQQPVENGTRGMQAQQGEVQSVQQARVPLAPTDTATAPLIAERPALTDSVGGLLPTTLAGSLSSTAAQSAEVAGAHRLVNASVRANINWMIEQGLSRATLQLNPAELGALSIKLETIGDQLNVNIHAAQAATRDVLEQTLPRLREHLSQQGFSEVNVTLGNNQQQSAEYSQGRNGGSTTQLNSDPVSGTESAVADAGGDTVQRSHRGMVDLFA